jgi:hypothetical protein
VVLRLSVASQYAPLYLSTWFGGKAKVTVRWRVLGWLTSMAMLLALAWLVCIRCAIGCVPVSGLDTLTTLGSGAGVCMHTLGVDAGVGAGAGAYNILGVDAGVVTQVVWATGGMVDVVGVLKIAWRLSTARSWAWQLSCVQSACMVTVKALR